MKFHIYCNIMRIYLSARPSVQSRAGRHLKWPGNSRSALPSLLRQFAPDSTPFQRLLDPFELGSDWVTLFCKSLSSGQARKGSWFLVSNIPLTRSQSENSFLLLASSRLSQYFSSWRWRWRCSGDNERTNERAFHPCRRLLEIKSVHYLIGIINSTSNGRGGRFTF